MTKPRVKPRAPTTWRGVACGIYPNTKQQMTFPTIQIIIHAKNFGLMSRLSSRVHDSSSIIFTQPSMMCLLTLEMIVGFPF